MRISDWSSDVCSSDLRQDHVERRQSVRGDDQHVRIAERVDVTHLALVQTRDAGDRRFVKGLHGARDEAVGQARIVENASGGRSEEHTSELQSLIRISYAVFCWKKNNRPPGTSTQRTHYI